jgi:hypothetical protein
MDQVIVTAKMIREARERREAESAQGAFNLSRARPLKELMAESRARKEAAAAVPPPATVAEAAQAAFNPGRARPLKELMAESKARKEAAAAAAAAASAAPAPVAAPAPAPVAAPAAPVIVPRSEIVPDYIKNIKVGDTITYGQARGYMGDGGDDRDVGYTVTRKVLKLLGNYTYEVETQYEGNKPEKFRLDNTGEWLRDTNYGRLTVVKINNTYQPEEMSEAALARRTAVRTKRQSDKDKRAIEKAAEFKEDYTKGSKTDLVEMIKKFMSARGKRLTNLNTASRKDLLMLIQKYNIVSQ